MSIFNIKRNKRTVNGQEKVYQELQIFRLDTKETVCDFVDTLAIGRGKEGVPELFDKIKVSITTYGSKAHVTLIAWLDLSTAWLMATDILLCFRTSREENNKNPYTISEFKGGPDPKSPTGYMSRVLTLTYWPDGGRGAGAYKIEIVHQPGVQGDKGQVMPSSAHKDDAVKVQIVASIFEMRRAAVVLLGHIQAKYTTLIAKKYGILFPVPMDAQAGYSDEEPLPVAA
jgi:hypothetical protein